MGKVLVACEFSGVVRDAFLAEGHDAISCDLLPTERPGPHIQGDVRELLREPWDLVIAHPPCQKLTAVNDCWTNNFAKSTWEEDYYEAVTMFVQCRAANAPLVAVENPVMHRRARQLLGKPDCVVNPFDFGSIYRKRTGFWLKGLPPLMSTYFCPDTVPWVSWRGQLPNEVAFQKKGHRNAKMRSQFHPEMAAAMAQQWSNP